MKLRRTMPVVAAAVCFLAFSVPSHAVTISEGSNNPYSFSWSYSSSAGTLSGTGELALSGFNTNSLSVAVTLNNTSGLSSNRLTAFGFGIDPNATSVGFSDIADGGMINVTMSQIPSLATIEVCAFGGRNCAGGSNGGILGGGSDSFTILLGGNWGSSVNIDPIGFKYQTGNGSFEFTTGNGGSVPEPGPLALFGLGLAALTLRRRRDAR